MNNLEFGNYLRELRKKKKLTIRQLDTYSGVSHSYISQVERGNRGIPSPEILEKLAKPLGVDYEELMIKAGYMKEVKEKFSPEIQPHLDEEFIDTVNEFMKQLFNDDLYTKEDYAKVGLPEDASIEEFINSLTLPEKIDFLKDYMTDNPFIINTNDKFFSYIKAISGEDTKITLDLSDDSVIDKLNLYYDDMELTRDEKIEFLAIARGIFSARRALKEKT